MTTTSTSISLKGKVAFISGASKGIGVEIAEYLAAYHLHATPKLSDVEAALVQSSDAATSGLLRALKSIKEHGNQHV